MVADLLGQTGLQIAAGQAFEEVLELIVLGGGNHGVDAQEQTGVEAGMIANLVNGAVHEVGGGDVKLPEVFGLPGSKGFGVDGLDVSVGEQGKHLEHLRTADFFSEGADVFRVEDVAAQSVGHFDVKANELEDGIAFFGVEVQAGEEGVGQFDAGGDVVVGAPGLAGVVEQQSEEEEVEAIDFRQKLGEALIVFMGGLTQAVDIVDDEEGMFIDCVAVITVADDQGVDAVKLGDEHLQNAEGVHGAEGVSGVRPEQDSAQRVPQIRAFRNVDGERGQGVGDAVFSGLRERVAVRGHESEDAQDGAGVIELRSGSDVEAALVEEEGGAGDGDAAAAELAVEADRRGHVFHEQGGAAIDDAGMTIVGAHPVGGIGGATRLQADGVGGGFVLGLPVEGVVVAAVAEVEKTSGGGEEVEGGLGIAARALKDTPAVAGPLLGFLEVEEHGEPDGEVVVAQATGAVLEVGLEVEDGVAEFGVADAGHLAELLGDGVPLAEDQAGQDGLVELLVEGEMAGEEAAVECGQGEFEIAGIEAARFLQGAGTGAGAQAYLPHSLNDRADLVLGVRLGFVVGKDEEHVDVGVGEEILAAVSAQGQEGDVRRRLAGKNATPHFNEGAVDHGGAAADGGSAVSGAFVGLADERHLPRILLPKIVNRQSDWIHKVVGGLPPQDGFLTE